MSIDLPEASTNETSKDGKSRFYRGVHLIKNLRHIFLLSNRSHTMSMTVHKDSVKEPFILDEEGAFVEIKPIKTPKIFNEEDFYGSEIDYDEE